MGIEISILQFISCTGTGFAGTISEKNKVGNYTNKGWGGIMGCITPSY